MSKLKGKEEDRRVLWMFIRRRRQDLLDVYFEDTQSRPCVVVRYSGLVEA